MFEVMAHGEFAMPRVVLPGDQFILYIDGKPVHARPISSTTYITHWAHVVIAGVGEGYFVGRANLLATLRKYGSN